MGEVLDKSLYTSPTQLATLESMNQMKERKVLTPINSDATSLTGPTVQLDVATSDRTKPKKEANHKKRNE